MRRETVGFIFARGGSKGVPRKNLRQVAGRSLIERAVDIGRACPSLDRIVVSTDDREIAAAAKSAGARVPFMRPEALATDHAPEWLAWRHAIHALEESEDDLEVELFVSLPPVSPLREVEDVEACIQAFRRGGCDAVITVTPARRSPYFNMVVGTEGDLVQLAASGGPQISRRQDAPDLFDMATVAYVVDPSFILSAESLFEGSVRAVIVPEERAIDVDTELDLRVARALASDKDLAHRTE